MRNKQFARTLNHIDNFLAAAGEPDIANVLTDLGLENDLLQQLAAAREAVVQVSLEASALYGRRKTQTEEKQRLRALFQLQYRRLSDLIRSHYPRAPWLSILGLDTLYRNEVDGSAVNRRATALSRSEASLRSHWFQFLENLKSLEPEVQELLAARGWDGVRITSVLKLLQEYIEVSDQRDSTHHALLEKSAILKQKFAQLSKTYRLYSRQIRQELGDDPVSIKLRSASDRVK